LVEFTVPAGRHDVELRLEDTNVRRAGNWLSLVSWTVLVIGTPSLCAWRRVKTIAD
jgi:hypothetical protein